MSENDSIEIGRDVGAVEPDMIKPRYSIASSSALDSLMGIEQQLDRAEVTLSRDIEVLRRLTFGQLVDFKAEIAQLHGSLEKLQFTRIDAVMTGGLTSGRDTARARRKAANKRCSALVHKASELFATLTALVKERAPRSSIDVAITTWNVGNAEPNIEEMARWLGKVTEGAPDIVAIGLQECQYHTQERKRSKSSEMVEMLSDSFKRSPTSVMSKKKTASVIKNAMKNAAKHTVTDTSLGEHLLHLLCECIGREDYLLVEHQELMEMRLFIFAKKCHRNRISEVTVGTRGTGIGNVLGNKGGVYVQLSFQFHRIVFVSCHLAAHMNHLKDRNKQIQTIFQSAAKSIGEYKQSVFVEAEHIFVFGDLNYRLDPGTKQPSKTTPHEEKFRKVCAMVKRKQYHALLKDFDQLRAVQHAGDAFVGFKEGEITFAPTFKVEKDVSDCKYVDKRVPSYTDRILSWEAPGIEGALVQKSINSCTFVKTSDHKPVFARYQLNLTATNRRKTYAPHVLKPMSSWKRIRGTTRDGVERLSGNLDASDVGAGWEEGLQIVFLGISAKNLLPMDPCGTSDPYIVFNSTHLFVTEASRSNKSRFKTSHVKSTLSPSWSKTDIPVVITHVKEPEEFADAQLSLSFFDKDPSISKDDYMGDATLTLRQAVRSYLAQSGPKSSFARTLNSDPVLVHDVTDIPNAFGFVVAPTEFEVAVTRNGQRAGTVKGSYLIVPPNVKFEGARNIGRASSMNCCVVS